MAVTSVDDEWFCEEHQQPLIAEEDILPGTRQICLECEPRYYAMTTGIDDTGEQYLPVKTARFTPRGYYDETASLSNMGTLIGEDQSITYVATVKSGSPSGVYGFTFTLAGSGYTSDLGRYFWIHTNFDYENWGYSYLPSYEAAHSEQMFDDRSITPVSADPYGYLKYVFSGRFIDSSDFNNITLYRPIVNFGPNDFVFYFGPMYLTTYPYGGIPPVRPPDFEDEDGWFGKLVHTIIDGINTVITGIVNLPGNVASALKGMFDAIKNAVTAIGNQITNALETLGNFLIDGLKSLFIPSDGYFESVAADMQQWLNDHLGLLVYPFELVGDFAVRVAALDAGEPTAHIPEIAFSDGEDKHVLIAEQDVNLYDQVGRNETFLQVHDLYLMAMDAAIAVALSMLAWRKFDQITGGGVT